MLTKLSLSGLRNAELIQYLTQLLETIPATGLPAPAAEAANGLRRVLTELDALHKTDPASLITDELIALDAERDALYTGLLAFCNSFSYHNDGELRKAGTDLQHALGVYGNAAEVTRQGYAAESTDIESLLTDLAAPALSAATARTGATVWTAPLKTANDRFKARFLDRNDEAAAKEFTFTMKQKRKEAATAYELLRRKLNAAWEMGAAELEAAIGKGNALTETYRELVAARKGRAEVRKEAAPGA
ncbi:DUF6261 family protein [Flaviaesturariibacter amylovorans]|uniref:Hemagglutinin n=1 Tax=Flaviaesturariibacter amylovorans TaxID=1084520 RepID=A0ABP8HA29_9BACT